MMRRNVLLILLILLLCALPCRAEAEGSVSVSNHIPVLTLTIDPEEYQKVVGSARHEYRAECGTIRIDVPDGWKCEYGEPDLSVLGTELPLAYIRGRGNSTWLEDKKPFKFRLEEAADLFAMGANEHWVLLAGAMDDSLMRNRLMGYIGDAFGLAYTSKFVPVDLVVNGEYQGSYLLGEQVRVGENRIEIDKIKKSETKEPGISGGYLLSMSPTVKDADAGKFTLASGLSFLIETPELDEYDESQQEAMKAQKDYITAYLQQVEDAVFGEGFRNAAGKSVGELMDLESAAKYWWMQAFSYNNDAFASTSTYLYKERNGKLYWGPLWDFDRSFWINGDDEYLNSGKMLWLDHLRENNPEYQKILRETWERLDEILKEAEAEGGVLDRYKEEIRLSWEKDYALWHGGAPQEDELDQVVENIRLNIRLRREAIERVIDTELNNVFANVRFADGEEVLAQIRLFAGESLSAGDFPGPPEKNGFAFVRWSDEEGRTFDGNTLIYSDMTVRAVYQAKETEQVPETQPGPPDAETDSPDNVIWIVTGSTAVLAAALLITCRRKKEKKLSF